MFKNFFLSLAYLYIEFSLFLFSLSILLNGKMCFPLLPFETFNTLRAYSCFRTNHSYIRIISRETCKQVNVTSSQGNDISIIKSRVHFPSKIDFSIFDVDGTVECSRIFTREQLSALSFRYTMDNAKRRGETSSKYLVPSSRTHTPISCPLKWKKFVVSKNRDPCSLIGIGFGRGESVSRAETLEPTFSPKRVRVTSGKIASQFSYRKMSGEKKRGNIFPRR